MQFDGWLKVLFADIGRPDDTRATIAEARAWAERVQSQGRRVAADYLDGTYLAGAVPIEDRAHVLPLTFALLWDLAQLVRRWNDWADELAVVPDLYETFYGITLQRRYEPPLIGQLLARPDTDILLPPPD